jgi:hypothetical protein
MSEEKKIWQLKETAKWSDDTEAKKTAINELSNRGETALSSLEEILNVTMHEDIKKICIDTIKAIREKRKPQKFKKKNQKGQRRKANSDWLTYPPNFLEHTYTALHFRNSIRLPRLPS